MISAIITTLQLLINNYFSLWIENLGVVPLFSFSFFLFLPMFFFLFFLILLVSNVLEPILKTFVKLLNLKHYFLTLLICLVKAFLIQSITLHAATQHNELKTEEYFLSIGEQISIKAKKLAKFSVGNKAVISTKFYNQANEILVKGKSIGFSDIVIRDLKSRKRIVHIYIISKKEQLKSYKIASALNKLNLEVIPLNTSLLVKGSISNIQDYEVYLKIIKNENIISKVTLTKELKIKLIGTLYKDIGKHVSHIYCNFIEINIHCDLKTKKIIKGIEKKYQKKFNVLFSHLKTYNQIENFIVELKIIKIEKNLNNNSNLGTNKLEGKLGDILYNQENLYVNNDVIMTNDNIHAKVVASPRITVSLNEQGHIELGSESPFTTQNQFGQQTKWKFAGLKLKVKLSEYMSRLKVSLESQLTAPKGVRISGNKVKQSFILNNLGTKKVFQVKFNSEIENESGLPIIRHIPILNSLFNSQEFSSSEIILTGFLNIKEERNE